MDDEREQINYVDTTMNLVVVIVLISVLKSSNMILVAASIILLAVADLIMTVLMVLSDNGKGIIFYKIFMKIAIMVTRRNLVTNSRILLLVGIEVVLAAVAGSVIGVSIVKRKHLCSVSEKIMAIASKCGVLLLIAVTEGVTMLALYHLILAMFRAAS